MIIGVYCMCIEREREREIYIYIHIYINIHIQYVNKGLEFQEPFLGISKGFF